MTTMYNHCWAWGNDWVKSYKEKGDIYSSKYRRELSQGHESRP